MSQDAKVGLSAIQNVKAIRERSERVCLNTYSLTTVKKTCYRFSSRYFSALNSNDSEAIVTFSFPSTVSADEEQDIITRFHQDLLDQDLREAVAAETETTRTLILANAFANTDLVDDSDD